MNLYDADRLVAAANLFDIAPQLKGYIERELPGEVKNALSNCKEKLKVLSESRGLDLDDVISDFKRLGADNLKSKIKYHAKPILQHSSDLFPKFEWVIKRAVDCRNYFVHGNQKKKLYYSSDKCMIFLTQTLEYIFGVSTLSECGWDYNAWCRKSGTPSHPMLQYRQFYHEGLNHLETLCKAKS